MALSGEHPRTAYPTIHPGTTPYVIATLSFAAALIHLWAMPDHFAEWWGYGAFFLATAAAQAAYGAALLLVPRRALLPLGIVGNLAIVSLYVVTRTAGVPFLGPHAGEVEAVSLLDLSAMLLELALVAVLVALLRGRGVLREGWSIAVLGLALVLTPVLLSFGPAAVHGHHLH